MNIINIGCGTDTSRLIKEFADREDSAQCRALFIDPSMGNPNTMHPCVEFDYRLFEDAILSRAINDQKKLVNLLNKSELYLERVLEHIPLDRLLTLSIPLLINIANNFDASIDIVVPTLDRIIKSVDHNDIHPFMEHHLASLETIALGDHKVVFTISQLRRYFGDLDFSISSVNRDQKNYYTGILLKSKFMSTSSLESFVSHNMNCIDLCCGTFIELSDALWEQSNEILLNRVRSNTAFSFRFINAKKIFSFTHAPLSMINTKDKIIANIEEIQHLVTCEGHWELIENELFNVLHPYESAVTFKHTGR